MIPCSPQLVYTRLGTIHPTLKDRDHVRDHLNHPRVRTRGASGAPEWSKYGGTTLAHVFQAFFLRCAVTGSQGYTYGRASRPWRTLYFRGDLEACRLSQYGYPIGQRIKALKGGRSPWLPLHNHTSDRFFLPKSLWSRCRATLESLRVLTPGAVQSGFTNAFKPDTVCLWTRREEGHETSLSSIPRASHHYITAGDRSRRSAPEVARAGNKSPRGTKPTRQRGQTPRGSGADYEESSAKNPTPDSALAPHQAASQS